MQVNLICNELYKDEQHHNKTKNTDSSKNNAGLSWVNFNFGSKFLLL